MVAETIVVDLGSDAGVKWEFQPEDGQWGAIKVPYGGYRKQGHKCDAGTYRTQLAIPAGAKGKSVQLYFEAINFGCQILIGEDEASLKPILSHVAPWVPVIVDLTPHVAGRQDLYCLWSRSKAATSTSTSASRCSTTGPQAASCPPRPGNGWFRRRPPGWKTSLRESSAVRGCSFSRPSISPNPISSPASPRRLINPYVKVNNITDRPTSGRHPRQALLGQRSGLRLSEAAGDPVHARCQ